MNPKSILSWFWLKALESDLTGRGRGSNFPLFLFFLSPASSAVPAGGILSSATRDRRDSIWDLLATHARSR